MSMVYDILSFIGVAWSCIFLLLGSALASPICLTSQEPPQVAVDSLCREEWGAAHSTGEQRRLREVLIVYSLHLIQGRAWMLLLQPVLGREKSVGIGPPSRGSRWDERVRLPMPEGGRPSQAQGSVDPNGSVSWHQVAVTRRSWDADHW